jgi:hypothetical protein
VAGLAVGFMMGAKYTGLLFAGACGLGLVALLILQRGNWFRHGTILTATAAVIGSQWFVWNWINSGDPFFPLLFGTLDVAPDIWDATHQAVLQAYQSTGEREVPINIGWLLAYPFVATLDGLPGFESARTGLGPFALLVLPMAVFAMIQRRGRLRDSLLLTLAAISALYYVLWFGSGVSQRIRHLLPVYPLVLITLTVAAQRWGEAKRMHLPLILAAALTWSVQVAGDAIFARGFIQHVFSGESRAAFLDRNVWGYPAVQWINQHMTADERVLVPFRNLIYLFDVPTFYAHEVQEARVDISRMASDPVRYLQQLHAQGITHVLATAGTPDSIPKGVNLWQTLASSGCLQPVKLFDVEVFQSRTLPALGRANEQWELLRLDEPSCDRWMANRDPR